MIQLNRKRDSVPVPDTDPNGSPDRLAAEDGRLTTLRRIAPALGLFVLAPLVAEYLLGNVAITEIVALIFLAPLYGGGALIIREVARRTGRGWAMMVPLALAYGLLEAGLLDQSLFNPSYMGQDFNSTAHIPGLGVSAYYALAFIGGHVIWSISVPIAVVESLVPDRATTPWLGKVGLSIAAIVFVVGCGLIFYDQRRTEHFLASPWQLAGTAVVILAAVGIAMTAGRRPRPQIDRPVPHVWQFALGAFVGASLFFALVPSWWGVTTGVVLLAATLLVRRWSRRTSWTATHRFPLAAGALLTYVWGGFTLPPPAGSTAAIKLIGNVTFALGAVTLVAAATAVQRRARRQSPPLP